MALPEFSVLRHVPAHAGATVYGKDCMLMKADVLAKDEERGMVEAEIEYALSAARAAVDKAEGSLSYTAARDAAKALHLLDAHARPSCTPSVSDSIWESCPQAIDVLVSKDALFREAQRWFKELSPLTTGADALRAPFCVWWALRVGAEHCRPLHGGFSSARCHAIWTACRAHWLALAS